MNTKFTIHEHPAAYTYPGAVDYTFDCMSIVDESTLQAVLIPMDNPNWEKHLKLIAAAPELLALLKEARCSLQIEHNYSLVNDIDAAIMKATE